MNARRIEKGDICIVLHNQIRPDLIGSEVTITEDLRYYEEEHGYPAGWYFDTDSDFLYEEHELKLKRYGGEDKVFDLFHTLDDSLVKDEKLCDNLVYQLKGYLL